MLWRRIGLALGVVAVLVIAALAAPSILGRFNGLYSETCDFGAIMRSPVKGRIEADDQWTPAQELLWAALDTARGIGDFQKPEVFDDVLAQAEEGDVCAQYSVAYAHKFLSFSDDQWRQRIFHSKSATTWLRKGALKGHRLSMSAMPHFRTGAAVGKDHHDRSTLLAPRGEILASRPIAPVPGR